MAINEKSLKNLKSYKPSWNYGRTRTIRVPIALADQVLEIARAIDEGRYQGDSNQELLEVVGRWKKYLEQKSKTGSKPRSQTERGKLAYTISDNLCYNKSETE